MSYWMDRVTTCDSCYKKDYKARICYITPLKRLRLCGQCRRLPYYVCARIECAIRGMSGIGRRKWKKGQGDPNSYLLTLDNATQRNIRRLAKVYNRVLSKVWTEVDIRILGVSK